MIYSPQEDLKQKLIWLMTLRMVVIITLLGSAILIQLVSRTILPINPLYFLIFLSSLFTLFYAFIFNRVPDSKSARLSSAYWRCSRYNPSCVFHGGSQKFLFVFVHTVNHFRQHSAYRPGSMYIASAASISYGALLVILHYNVLPHYDLDPYEIASITYKLLYYYIFIHLFVFYFTGMLSSYLSERLRRTRTALEEMDEDLSDLRFLHQKIIDNMTAGLIITNLEGQINFLNEPAIRILNLPIQNLLGTKIATLFVQEIQMEKVNESLQIFPSVSLERSLIWEKQGILVGMNFSYLHSQKGLPTGYLVIFQDITETRKMERQFRMQERMAAIGTMAAGIAAFCASRSGTSSRTSSWPAWTMSLSLTSTSLTRPAQLRGPSRTS